MTYFGETIRKAREAKGLTTSQIAEKTHILVQIINAMEREDFKPIKAAIYGRGFVKLICECLEIDPKPLVAEFMEIYEGRRPPVSGDSFMSGAAPYDNPVPSTTVPPENKAATFPDEPAVSDARSAESTVHADSSASSPCATDNTIPGIAEAAIPGITEAAAKEPQEISRQESGVEQPLPAYTSGGGDTQTMPVQPQTQGLDLFAPPAVTTEPPRVTRAQDIFASTYTEPEDSVPAGPSAAEKFRNSLSVVSHGVLGSVCSIQKSMRNIPRSAWRMAVLVVGALIVLGLLFWGCIILYRVTEHPAVPADQPGTASTLQTEAPAKQPAAKSAVAAKQAKPSATQSPHAAKPASKPVAKDVAAGNRPRPKLRSTGQKVPPLYVD